MRRASMLLAQAGPESEVEGAAAEVAQQVAPLQLGWLILAVALLATAFWMFSRRTRATRWLAALVGLLGIMGIVLAVNPLRTTAMTVGTNVGGLLADAGRWALRSPFPFPIVWGILLGSIGLILMLPRTTSKRLRIGAGISLLGLLVTLAGVDPLGEFTPQVVFYVLVVLTVGPAAAAISMRSPVYTAIWFAISLLGTAGLFLYQGAEFLGVATIVVYAGAIVVTFLFVLMLAQPEGHATYDRITWGSIPKPLAVLGGAWLLATLAFLFVGPSEQTGGLPTPALMPQVMIAPETVPAGESPGVALIERELQHPQHMAHLGGQLFGRHLISVELAGTLLLIALVGAVAIAIQGKRPAGSTGTERPTGNEPRDGAPRDVASTQANRISTSGAPGADTEGTGS